MAPTVGTVLWLLFAELFFVSALKMTAFNCIIFLKKLGNDFQLKIHYLIEDAAKFRSQCEKHKMILYLELQVLYQVCLE